MILGKLLAGVLDNIAERDETTWTDGGVDVRIVDFPSAPGPYEYDAVNLLAVPSVAGARLVHKVALRLQADQMLTGQYAVTDIVALLGSYAVALVRNDSSQLAYIQPLITWNTAINNGLANAFASVDTASTVADVYAVTLTLPAVPATLPTLNGIVSDPSRFLVRQSNAERYMPRWTTPPPPEIVRARVVPGSAYFPVLASTSDGTEDAVIGTPFTLHATITDADSNSFALSLQLVDQSGTTVGTITLATTTGLSFLQGDGTDDATIACYGSKTNLNNALNGFTVNYSAGSGGSQLQMQCWDGGGSNGAQSGNASNLLTITFTVSSGAVFTDHFTDTNGTALAAHTPDLGGGWTVNRGTWQIQSNKCLRTDSGPGSGTIWADAGVSDATGSVQFTTDTNVGPVVGQTFSLLFRVTDVNNFYMAQMDSATSTFKLYKNVANSLTQLGATQTANFVASTTYTTTAIISGTSLIVSCVGTGVNVSVNTTDSAFTTQTKWGIDNYVAAGAYTSCPFDNFSVAP